MTSPTEALFRETMRTLLVDDACGLPPGLRRDIRDHLSRRDGEGHTLCFDSPQREQLLRLLFHWAERDNPAVAAYLTAGGLVSRDPAVAATAWGNDMAMEAPRAARTPVTLPRTTSRPARPRRTRTAGQERLFA